MEGHEISVRSMYNYEKPFLACIRKITKNENIIFS